ncbi:MAG: hypothetical protein LBC03_05260 [Nitrososphaerota archaeon]|jgi:D-alanine-D-alanine ligase|nr:hypothetical protein [Nitrososphaerota archaeon]
MPNILFLGQFAPTLCGTDCADLVNNTDVFYKKCYESLLNKPNSPEEAFYYETYHLAVFKALVELHKTVNFDFFATSDIKHLVQNHDEYDLVWSVYNRIPNRSNPVAFCNSEVFIQSLCEYYDIRYIGAPPNIRATAQDKRLAKLLAKDLGLKTAEYVVASKRNPLKTKAPFPPQYFVKPRFGSASIDIDETCLCYNWEDAITKSEEYFSNNIEVIVEKFIDGIYYGVPVMNTKSNTPIIGVPHYQTSDKIGHVITHKQKRFTEGGMRRYIERECFVHNIIEDARKYYKALQPCDYARIDFMIERKTGIAYFSEVNILMNIGIKSGFVQSFLQKPVGDIYYPHIKNFNSYNEIIQHIIELGLNKLI